jgi:hypothetical protein
MKVYVTTFSILHKLFKVEVYSYCEIIALGRWTCCEATELSYCQAVGGRP